MNVARPITAEEYAAFNKELSEIGYSVPLDDDPTIDPKGLNAKFKLVQGYKDRVLILLNRAIKAEAYWKAMMKKVEMFRVAEYSKAMVTEEVKKGGSEKTRDAMATNLSDTSMNTRLFQGKGTFQEHVAQLQYQHTDAVTFQNELQNIFDNLESTASNLSRQLKSVIVNTRLYSELGEDGMRSKDRGAIGS